jgi:hypothetical protein
MNKKAKDMTPEELANANRGIISMTAEERYNCWAEMYAQLRERKAAKQFSENHYDYWGEWMTLRRLSDAMRKARENAQ